MPSILIHVDEATLRALNQIAARGKRKRAEFFRKALKDAIRQQQYARIRAANIRQPDSPSESIDWSNWEAYKP